MQIEYNKHNKRTYWGYYVKVEDSEDTLSLILLMSYRIAYLVQRT
jgi:hypothetical protein